MLVSTCWMVLSLAVSWFSPVFSSRVSSLLVSPHPALLEAVSWMQDFVPALAEFCQCPAWPLSPSVVAELHLLPLSPCAQATWFGVTKLMRVLSLSTSRVIHRHWTKQGTRTGPAKTWSLTASGRVQNMKHYPSIPARLMPIKLSTPSSNEAQKLCGRPCHSTMS